MDKKGDQGSLDLYREIVRIRDEGGKAALATIVKRLGSTPRKDHAKMLIREDGSCLGTVGGGCVEAEVWQLGKKVIETRRPSFLKYSLTDEDIEEEGLVCGGTVEVFVEPIVADPRVVLLGAGHVAQAIAEAVHRLGYRVTIVDDRAGFASPERFPWANQLHVLPFEDGLDSVRISTDSFILVVTRGHRHDQSALEGAIRCRTRYVGLIGSRRKIRMLVENLLQKGHPPEAFENLYAPIGLDIGSETPEEIAVSVAAELIALQKGVHGRSEKQEFIRRVLDEHKEKTRQPARVEKGA